MSDREAFNRELRDRDAEYAARREAREAHRRQLEQAAGWSDHPHRAWSRAQKKSRAIAIRNGQAQRGGDDIRIAMITRSRQAAAKRRRATK